RSQSRAGGWLYTPDSNSDEGSVTITQIQALRACRNAGIAISEDTAARAVDYVRNSANPDGSIRYRVSSVGDARPAITAAAVAVLYNAGRYDDPIAEKALAYARRTLPVNGSGNGHHYYAQAYLSQALYQRGGTDWDDHYSRLSRWLLAQQRADGSWMGDHVGTTYGTALGLTILQLPYAYLPIYQR
ncbi:MAG: terpene cyclase/mutase family protein, partial [Myxococcales bacterium]|nr:terpene cyclase/mutase family protein [Myxococcales bacterium]